MIENAQIENDSTSCTTEISKMCFSFFRSLLRYAGEGASYLGLCLCVSAVHRKIKIQNKFKSRGEMALGGSTTTFLLPSAPLAHGIENAPLSFAAREPSR